MNAVPIDGRTTICAVIGNPIEHSLSPAIHNAAFAARGINGAYVAFNVTHLKKAIEGIRGLGIRGVSVTIPHKIAVMPLLDTIDETARTIGSINTIVNTGGHLAGYNSDGIGALQALRDAGCNPTGKRVTILGSGGAARAIAVTIVVSGPSCSTHASGYYTGRACAAGIGHCSKKQPQAGDCRVLSRWIKRCAAGMRPADQHDPGRHVSED